MNISDEQNSAALNLSPNKKLTRKPSKSHKKTSKYRASSRNPTAKPLFTPARNKNLPLLESGTNMDLIVQDAYDILQEEVK